MDEDVAFVRESWSTSTSNLLYNSKFFSPNTHKNLIGIRVAFLVLSYSLSHLNKPRLLFGGGCFTAFPSFQV